MKNLFLFVVMAIILSGCGKKGSSFASGGKNFGFEAPPLGMVFIEPGSFQMGSSDEDIMWSMGSSPKPKTVDGFWMDETEVTNAMYRDFVGWTMDSIARRTLAEADIDGFIIESDEEEDEEQPQLNYKTKIVLKGDSEHLSSLKDAGFYYSKEESIDRKREIDSRKITYEYDWFDYQQAAQAKWDPEEGKYIGTVVNMKGETEEIVDRSSFIMSDKVYIYPDTLCWIRDFMYSYNDPFATMYFSHPSYNFYPVVGVSWSQARAYTHWRTNFGPNRVYKRQYAPHAYRLPTEAEFEYAARGGLNMQMYPWGGPYATNKYGCYLANFKPQRGNYALDGATRTMSVANFEPNDFGLYDMAGNVAEWTNDAYDENAYHFTHDLVPTYSYLAKDNDPLPMRRKVIRGGSWKDISYFLQCGTRNYEYQDSTKSYIGFRCVRDVLGQVKD